MKIDTVKDAEAMNPAPPKAPPGKP